MWVLLALCSALLLGVYDVFKKMSLKGNAVIPVLTYSILISALFFLFPIVLSKIFPEQMLDVRFYVPSVSFSAHLFIALKSVLVLGSWICAYFGMKNIPITIYAPIRATQPVWTVVGAIVIFSESLTGLQICGVTLTLLSFFLFSIAGKSEGVVWKNNQWIWLIILATIFGAASGLYDKHLMREFDRVAVQVYSTIYQSVIMVVVLFTMWKPYKVKTPFQWRWSILGISVFLMLADYVYYWALSYEDSMISIVSTIRRSGAVVPFLYGAVFLNEKNLKVKGMLLAGILLGVALLTFGAVKLG